MGQRIGVQLLPFFLGAQHKAALLPLAERSAGLGPGRDGDTGGDRELPCPHVRPHLGAPNPQLCRCPVLCYRRVSPSPATSSAIDHKGCRSPLVLSRRSLQSHREPARGLGTRSLWRPCPQAGDTAAAVCMEHDAAGHPGCSRSQAGRGGQRRGYVRAHRSHAHTRSQCSDAGPMRSPQGECESMGSNGNSPKAAPSAGNGLEQSGTPRGCCAGIEL